MNPGENQTGLRNLPLSHYLLRGMRPNAAAHYQELRQLQEEQAAVPPLRAGPFRVFGLDRFDKVLQECGFTRDSFIAGLSQGCDVFELTYDGKSSGSFRGLIGWGRFIIRLSFKTASTESGPQLGQSDWTLNDLLRSRDNHSIQPFSCIEATWRKYIHTESPLLGDALGLLRDLVVLQARRKECGEMIPRIRRLATGDTPELAEQLSTWRRVCDLERDLSSQVGVTRIERVGQDYRLIPEKQQRVEEWVEERESLNPEGVDWVRHKLEMRLGNECARLVVQNVESTPAGDGDGEIVLTVACDNPHGRAVADLLCDDDSIPRGGDDGVRLFLPDSQMNQIDDAVDWIDTNPDTRSRNRSGIVGNDLAPDDQTLKTLQTILTGADGLEPRQQDWPPLPVPPLQRLSPAQEKAVRAAVFGTDMTLIQGPPGTGKTTVILEILRQLFHRHRKNQGFKVLLVAPTHCAVDNVLERLVDSRLGTSLVMELGVALYRAGSTTKIAEHLRAFTPDCLNTEYCRRLETAVAESVRFAQSQAALEQGMIDTTAEGAKHDGAAWENALESGELPDDQWSSSWPQGLDGEWKQQVTTQSGRVGAWRHWRVHGVNPKKREELLRRWLAFLQCNPRFFSELLVANANLVCATTIGCATHPKLRAASYDYVIVDEAGKEEARRLLVPLIRGERWVLVGDHQQLPPYADVELQDRLVREGLDPRIVTRSLFEKLQAPFEKRGCYVFLDRQGRMHPDISAFISQRFYDGKLDNFPHAASHSIPKPSFLPDDPKLLVIDTGRLPDCSELRNNRGNGFFNPTEAKIAVHLLQAFVNSSTWTESCRIGVIAPYRRQVEELASFARRNSVLKKLLKQGLLHIGTVDSFQGQERDLIIFSCTRSNSRGAFGFADNAQRLNVALSRAKARLIVLLDGSTVERAVRNHNSKTYEVTSAEAETRDHLHALLEFARGRNGVIEVPRDWQQRWQG